MKSCLWLLALLPLHAPPAEACSSEPVSAIALDAALPRSGSSAPTNTWIWLPPSAADGAALDPGAIEVTQDGVAVEIDVVELAFADEAGRAMLVARPTAPLTPGLTVTVTVAGEVATAFEVAGTADEPPAPPRVVSVDVTGSFFGALSCPESSQVTVSLDTAGDLVLLTTSAATSLPARALGIAADEQVTGYDLAEGEQAIHVLALDLAGNASTAPLPTFTVPAEQSGCAATRSAPTAWVLVVVALLVHRGRRRRLGRLSSRA